MIYLLPGFFTDPDEFIDLKKALKPQEIEIIDLKQFSSLSLIEVGQVLALQMQDRGGIWMGYSLGGRLLLQSLRFSVKNELIFISTHPGLTEESQRQLRIQADHLWSEKFLNLEWSKLLKEWYSQEVFSGDLKIPSRSEASFDRHHLAWSLNEWSLGRQENMREVLLKTQSSIRWITGKRDAKFSALAKELESLRNPKIRFESVAEAGHRVHLDAPDLFAN